MWTKTGESEDATIKYSFEIAGHIEHEKFLLRSN